MHPHMCVTSLVKAPPGKWQVASTGIYVGMRASLNLSLEKMLEKLIA